MEWSQSVKLAVKGRAKFGYLMDSVKEPAETNPNFQTWTIENAVVMAWLLNSIEPTIAKTYLFLSTVEIWDTVKKTYSDRKNYFQIFELKSKL